jgi:D-alanine-D-alanine ligase
MRADASIGIDENSLVRGSTELMERVVKIHRELGDAALAEEYIQGREFYVGVIGNREPVAFPPMEMRFNGDGPHILDEKAKWDRGSAAWADSKAQVADISDELRAKLQKVSISAYRALKVRDYGRVDLRLTEANEIYVIEVNANCYLEKHDEFPVAAAAAGIEYVDLIERIAELALERQHVSKRHEETLTDAPG